MKLQLYSMRVLFFSLLLSIGMGNAVNGQTVTKTVENFTTGGDGTTATEGNILIYTITISTAGSVVVTNATLTDNIPAGTAYVPQSTTFQGASMSDVNGNMPFAASGNLGILRPDATFIIGFRVKVIANGGTITNTANLLGDGVSIPSNTTSTQVWTGNNRLLQKKLLKQ
jgi:uncharacterized repeat protein (TIGR01451 family)